jgi:Zn-dependent protease
MPLLTPELLALGLIWYIVFLFSTTCHEAAHALAAKWGGDLTAYHGGQVTLNPMPHMMREPLGMLVAPVVSFWLNKGTWMIGWASVPFDPYWAARNPRRAAWMALAGPAANLVLMLLAGIAIRVLVVLGYFRAPETANFKQVTLAMNPESLGFLATFLSLMFTQNLLLAAFNLLPVAPLDGHAGITLLMPERTALQFMDFMREGTVQIVGILAAWYFFDRLFRPIFILALNALYPGTGWG